MGFENVMEKSDRGDFSTLNTKSFNLHIGLSSNSAMCNVHSLKPTNFDSVHILLYVLRSYVNYMVRIYEPALGPRGVCVHRCVVDPISPGRQRHLREPLNPPPPPPPPTRRMSTIKESHPPTTKKNEKFPYLC